ncbi:16S rRNA (guanine(527)-N(7))-methyltransferase RsmG [Ammonifex thiophilus]|uniref:Ribosomal RNA small subunit methyltransferase G n=1 Tax=Ammonifex thiophilus TaxID=444093 RepID=A0A3D8P5I0_9THEO|nr:16S rRNA (guanine(527)-N(7))-methyltransferase RsmG [Ammonifex thiophilus]RDV84576.1 16S rRNA (guanine(527)-N(7))-methyltransferase RsmG [Ammonifex thiophilus]
MRASEKFLSALEAGLAAFGLSLPPGAREKMGRHFALLSLWGRRFSLTAISGAEEVAILHYLDSLAPLAHLPPPEGPCIDVGSGAGFPGIPLALALPEVKFVLLEATRKKVEFLRRAIEDIPLPNCQAVWGRAEEYGRVTGYRESFAWVVARAVAPLRELAEYTLPFARLGGLFLAYKGPRGEAELAEAARALSVLGGEVSEVWHYSLPGGEKRQLLVVLKVSPTPAPYPRRPGLARKRPL